MIIVFILNMNTLFNVNVVFDVLVTYWLQEPPNYPNSYTIVSMRTQCQWIFYNIQPYAVAPGDVYRAQKMFCHHVNRQTFISIDTARVYSIDRRRRQTSGWNWKLIYFFFSCFIVSIPTAPTVIGTRIIRTRVSVKHRVRINTNENQSDSRRVIEFSLVRHEQIYRSCV